MHTRDRHRLPSLQPRMVEKQQRDRVHTRLFPEPNRSLEIPQYDASSQFDRTHISSAVLGDESRWADGGNRRWGRDIEVLEMFREKRKRRCRRRWGRRPDGKMGRYQITTSTDSRYSAPPPSKQKRNQKDPAMPRAVKLYLSYSRNDLLAGQLVLLNVFSREHLQGMAVALHL